MSTKKPDISKYIEEFIKDIETGKTEIYNEFSLQHELGIFLRNKFYSIHEYKDYKVQFERNISHFGMSNKSSPKSEIDISIFKDKKEGCLATIELKYLKSQNVPNPLFDVLKDIAFMEVTTKHKFQEGFVLVIADHQQFYFGKNQKLLNKPPYPWFRKQLSNFGKNERIPNRIDNKVGKKTWKFKINGNYTINWKSITDESTDKRKFALIQNNTNGKTIK